MDANFVRECIKMYKQWVKIYSFHLELDGQDPNSLSFHNKEFSPVVQWNADIAEQETVRLRKRLSLLSPAKIQTYSVALQRWWREQRIQQYVEIGQELVRIHENRH